MKHNNNLCHANNSQRNTSGYMHTLNDVHVVVIVLDEASHSKPKRLIVSYLQNIRRYQCHDMIIALFVAYDVVLLP